MKAQYKPIAPLESNSFKAEHQVREKFDSPWHYHSEYELTLILSSTGVRYVGNHFEDFYEHDLVLLGPDLPHCWTTIGPQNVPASAVVIQWREDFLGKDWMNCKEFEIFKSLFKLSEKGVRFDECVALQLKEKFIRLANLQPLNKLISLLEILQELTHTTHFHTLCDQNFKYKLNHVDNERLKTVFQFVDNHFSEKVTLKQLSGMVCMTEESFSRFFSKVMNKPFFFFLNEYRINMACKLLLETNMPVAAIGYDVGYESFPFFHRQFKKFKNCTPQEFRKQYQLVEQQEESGPLSSKFSS
jgi:AraC-like DNA-binding protein